MKEELKQLYKEYREELKKKQNLKCVDSADDTLEQFFKWIVTGEIY